MSFWNKKIYRCRHCLLRLNMNNPRAYWIDHYFTDEEAAGGCTWYEKEWYFDFQGSVHPVMTKDDYYEALE